METKPLPSSAAVQSENKVTVESKVQRLDSNPTTTSASGPVLSVMDKEASSPTTVQEMSYATPVSNAETTLRTGDTPPSISNIGSSSKSVPITLSKQQSPVVMPDPAVTDRKLAIQSQNPPLLCIGMQLQSMEKNVLPTTVEKKSADDGKTVKRENSKGWF